MASPAGPGSGVSVSRQKLPPDPFSPPPSKIPHWVLPQPYLNVLSTATPPFHTFMISGYYWFLTLISLMIPTVILLLLREEASGQVTTKQDDSPNTTAQTTASPSSGL